MLELLHCRQWNETEPLAWYQKEALCKGGGRFFVGFFFPLPVSILYLNEKNKQLLSVVAQSLSAKLERQYKSCTGNKITQLGLYDQHETPQIH